MIEVYYFNTKMNYYEPMVEKTMLYINFEKASKNNQKLGIHIKRILNINFSIALFETLT